LSGGSVCRAAELMGVHRNTLSKKIRQHGISRSRGR
jgi:DNA-binding protein Fis